MAKIPEINNTPQLSLDFIAGLITGEGSFRVIHQNKGKQKVFLFQLRLHYDDRKLVFAVKNSLGLKEPVYEYKHQNRHSALLLVRRRETIEKIIIPAFNGRLFGLKKIQFEKWKKQFFEEKKNWLYQYTGKVPKVSKELPEF